MIIHNCEQRSGIWFNLRLGKITASNVHKLTTKAKFESYYYELLAETITRTVTEGYINDAMQWGIDNEPFAAEWYCDKTGLDASICGFIEDETSIAGCSPDLLVDPNGMAQIKCPNSKTHLYYRDYGPDKTIIYQMQWEMFVAQREWNDFISYDPRCKGLEGHIHRIERNEKIITELKEYAKTMQDRIEMFLFDNDIIRQRYVPPIIAPELTAQDLDRISYLRA
jgi:putative phage-type endonuclease